MLWRRPGEAKPVTIRGVKYASQAEAARRLGVSQNAISQASRKGRLDTTGLGRDGGRYREGKPVTIRGTTYRDAHAAAEALGVNVDTVHNAKGTGRLDQVGTRPRRKPK